MGRFHVGSYTRPRPWLGPGASPFKLPAPQRRRKSSRRAAAHAEGILRDFLLGMQDGTRLKDMREAAKKEERNPVFCTERAGDLATSCGGATKGYKLCV